MTNDVEHLLVCLLAICLFPDFFLVRLLPRGWRFGLAGNISFNAWPEWQEFRWGLASDQKAEQSAWDAKKGRRRGKDSDRQCLEGGD